MIVFLVAWLAFDLVWWQALILELLSDGPLISFSGKGNRSKRVPASPQQTAEHSRDKENTDG